MDLTFRNDDESLEDANPGNILSPSNSLAALEVLEPPSPILTPSQVAFSWSLDEIPVFLFDGGYIQGLDKFPGNSFGDSSLATDVQGELRGMSNDQNTVDEYGDTSCHVDTPRAIRTLPFKEDSENKGCYLEISNPRSSVWTNGSVGTFGPKKCMTPSKVDRNVSQQVIMPKTQCQPTYFDTSLSDCEDFDTTFYADGVDSNFGSVPTTTSNKLSDTRGVSAAQETASGGEESLSPRSGGDQDPFEYHGSETGPPPQEYLLQYALGPRRQNVHFVSDIYPEVNSPDAEDTEAGFSLPDELPNPHCGHPWLNDLTINFLIDQEGFRSAKPLFKFCGIVYMRVDKGDTLQRIPKAQFRPIPRQTFHFHHAPFESPPILRRMTLNGRDTHDYASKQAYLPLKLNGVYVVRGHEISTRDHSSELAWQFDYLVDDRRSDAPKRLTEGEKNFTPLTFLCSPELLLPEQGKRINVMHVFRKGVAPKLTAEKLQPPGVPSSNNRDNLPASPPKANSESPTKLSTFNLHRRVQSHVHSPTPKNDMEGAHIQIATCGERNPYSQDETVTIIQTPKRENQHRRASSAREYNPTSPTDIRTHRQASPGAKEARRRGKML